MIKNSVAVVEQSLQNGNIPVLPFELDMFRQELGRLGIEQGELGQLLGESMQISSETWHDNPAAEAVSMQSQILSRRAQKLMGEFRGAILCDYPESGESRVTLGSIVGIVYTGESEQEHFLLSGLTRTAPEIDAAANYPAHIEAATLRSPLGRAMLGLAKGQITECEANGKLQKVSVRSILQLDPRYVATGA